MTQICVTLDVSDFNYVNENNCRGHLHHALDWHWQLGREIAVNTDTASNSMRHIKLAAGTLLAASHVVHSHPGPAAHFGQVQLPGLFFPTYLPEKVNLGR